MLKDSDWGFKVQLLPGVKTQVTSDDQVLTESPRKIACIESAGEIQ